MNTLAVYAGSFNPVHAGHIHVISVAQQIFGDDSVKVVLADNPQKKYTVSSDKRSQWIKDITWINPDYINGFTCDYCDELMAMRDYDRIVLIRGVRSAGDLDVEMPLSGYNYNIKNGEYPTIFIPCPAALRDLSSSAVRVIAKRGWDDFWKTLYEPFCPKRVTFGRWQDIARDIWETYRSVEA